MNIHRKMRVIPISNCIRYYSTIGFINNKTWIFMSMYNKKYSSRNGSEFLSMTKTANVGYYNTSDSKKFRNKVCT